MRSHWEQVHVRSGVQANNSPVDGVVWRDFVFLPDTAIPWVRLYFSECHLDKGSYLRIVSLRDGDAQTLHMEHVEQWEFSSCYLNGHAVMLEIVAAAGSTKNYVSVDKVLAGDTFADQPVPLTICGGTDDRVPSTDARSGRIVGIGCSGWLISTPVASNANERLHLSAGHCFATGQVLQFGVPASSTTCALVNPPAAQQFAIDSAGSVSNNGGIGNDYWVFRCFPNSNTGLTTWQTQNAAFTLATSMPAAGTTLRNWGYGLDGTPVNAGANASSCGCANPNGARNQTQQTHTGPVVSIVGTTLNHSIDTCGGNSGSVVVVDATSVAIAIHTNAGCTAGGGSNSGTTVLNAGLQAAITSVANGTVTPPTNDNCAAATTIVAGTNGPFSSQFATNSTAFACVANAGADVWFKHTAGCTGSYTITTNTATTTFDTVLEVLSGTCAAPTSLACNDDVGGGVLASQVIVSLTAGQTYFIRVGGFSAATGSFDVVLTAPCIPANECATALTLLAGSNGPFSNAGATTSTPAWPCVTGTNDLWFTYAAPAASTVRFSTCNTPTTFDTTLQVFSGSCGALTSLGCNDDDVGCGISTRSTLIVAVTAAQTLFVRVGGFNGATGAFQVDVTRTPTNEDCATAIALANGTNGPFNTAGATTSQGFSCASGNNDIWFTYVAPCTGQLVVSTCTAARNFDTILEVFTGACGTLTSVGCNDDAGGSCGTGSTLSLTVTSGTTYRLHLGGFNSATGQTEITVACVVPNDSCLTATPIGMGLNGPFSSVGSSTNTPAFPCGSSAASDVWFAFTSPSSAPHTFSTCTATRNFDTVLEVFSGTCITPVSLGCNDDACGLGSRVTASLTQGQTYLVRVAGVSGSTGAFDVEVQSGTGTGTITPSTTVSLCPTSATLGVTGNPNIGNAITMTVNNTSGIGLLAYGFLPNVPVPTPCGCDVVGGAFGVGGGDLFFSSSMTVTIPKASSLVGVAAQIQGLDVFPASGGCVFAGIPFGATDITTVTIG